MRWNRSPVFYRFGSVSSSGNHDNVGVKFIHPFIHALTVKQKCVDDLNFRITFREFTDQFEQRTMSILIIAQFRVLSFKLVPLKRENFRIGISCTNPTS